MNEDPGRHLLLHAAPAGLLEGSRRGSGRGLALLAAAAGLLVGVAGGWLARGPAVEVGPEVALVAEPPPQAGLVPVRLVLHAPAAREVAVAGSWNGWSPEATPLVSAGEGLFHAWVEVPPGRHEYMFVVDGTDWVTDPVATVRRPDRFGRVNAVLEL